MDKAFTVLQVNQYIRDLLENDALLCEIKVEGEISNFKQHTSGHLYFTLKDSSASLNCVMFASFSKGLKFIPKNGTKVIISGHVSLYEKTGQYQLYAVNMKPVGEGDLAASFVRLYEKLLAEGLFDPNRKKPIPSYIKCVALITSPTSAAVKDMMKIIRKRNPGVKIVIASTLVQGDNAAPDIVRAINEVNEWTKTAENGADVIILGRGGGSAEDLWAFNEEIVARAICLSDIPIISAVGHEVDITISDFAADMRAPTPSAAAAVIEDISVQFLYTIQLKQKLDQMISHVLQESRYKLRTISNLLEKLSPYALWERGYAAIYNSDQVRVRSVSDLKKGHIINIYLQDGEASAQIMSTMSRGE